MYSSFKMANPEDGSIKDWEDIINGVHGACVKTVLGNDSMASEIRVDGSMIYFRHFFHNVSVSENKIPHCRVSGQLRAIIERAKDSNYRFRQD